MPKQGTDLTKLRKQIFIVDNTILSALAKRIHIVERIGAYKRAYHIKPLNAKLRDQRINEWIERGRRLGLSKKFVVAIYKIIHDHSVSVEKKSL